MHSNQNSLFIQDIVHVSTIIIHWTHYLFSDWLKAYSEFSLIISRKLQPITVYYWHGYYYPIYVVSFWGCALENQVPQTTTGNFCLWVTGKKNYFFHINGSAGHPGFYGYKTLGSSKFFLDHSLGLVRMFLLQKNWCQLRHTHLMYILLRKNTL